MKNKKKKYLILGIIFVFVSVIGTLLNIYYSNKDSYQNSLPSCATLGTPSECSRRSDCNWSNTSGCKNKSVLVTRIVINKKNVAVKVSETTKLTVVITPSNASNKIITWASSNNKIATVDKNGTVKGIKAGKVVITALSSNGIKDMCNVTVTAPTTVTSIKLNKSSLSINVGLTSKLTATITPSNASNRIITWTSSDNKIATVDKNGIVKGIKTGTVTITAKSSNGKTATCKVTVIKQEPTVKLDKTTVYLPIGTQGKIVATIIPSNADNKTITWTSSNEKIVTVDKSGNIKGIKVGTATITAKLSNGKIAKCTVNVIVPEKTTPTPTATSTNSYTIKYNANGGSGTMDNQTCETNKSCTIKSNSFTKSGYTFGGWTTKSNGTDDGYGWTGWSGTWKYKNSEYGISNNTLTLYAIWIGVLPETFVIPTGYTNDVAKSYSSSTLKYKTIKKDDATKYYSLVWVKDANKQLNVANNSLNGGNRLTILSNEVKNMNYGSKGLIATNGSFTWDNRANIPVIITKGSSVNNDKYVTQKSDGTSLVYATLTIGSNNLLTYKTTTSVTDANNWLKSVGARNTWAISFFETSNWNGGKDGGAEYRSAICQVNENNFVLYSGYSDGIHDYMKELHDLFGCKIVVNLDGGGSTGMYYKTKSMTDVGTVYQYNHPSECCSSKCSYKCRSIADMLYFVES